MDIMKPTVKGCSLQKHSLPVLHILPYSNLQAMNDLIIVFVSREGWSAAITIIDTNYKASNLIPISFVESSNFWRRL